MGNSPVRNNNPSVKPNAGERIAKFVTPESQGEAILSILPGVGKGISRLLTKSKTGSKILKKVGLQKLFTKSKTVKNKGFDFTKKSTHTPKPKPKLLGEGGVIRTTEPHLAANIKKPLDLTKPHTKHGGVSEKANVAWFGPKSRAGAYSKKGRQVFSANLQYSKPYHINVDQKWTNESLKKIKDKGYDIIIAGRDQYSQIPLDKNIIKNLKRIK